MKTNLINHFTNKYQLQKTLRFELKPIGKTKFHIENKGILKKDEERARSYLLMKKIIDEFHKHFIEVAMQQVELNHLQEFEELYYASAEQKKEDTFKKELQHVQTALRKEIVKGFKTGEANDIFQNLFKKELFTKLLDSWVKNIEDKSLVEDFKTFTTYFSGFHENRKNMYTDKEQSTAIAYRLIHENLPKFLDNIKIFNQVVEKLGDAKIKEIENQLEPIIQGTPLSEIFKLNYYNNVLTQTGIVFINYIIGGYTENDGKTKVKGLNEYINLYNQKQEKKNRIPKLKILYKQLLSDRDSISFLPEAFEDDDEKTASQKVLDAINSYYRDNLICYKANDKEDTENVLEETKKLLAELTTSDLSKVYIRNDRAITDISQTLFKDYSVIKNALKFQFIQSLDIGKNGLTKKQEEAIEKYLKQKYFSIAEIENALFAYQNETDALSDLKENAHPIAEYFTKHFKAKKEEETDKDFDLIANIDAKYSCIKGLLNVEYPKDKQLNQDKKTINDIKAFLDSLMEYLHFVKPLALPNDSTLDKDQNFYSQFETYYEQLELLIPLYNKVRNFATKKPYCTEKFKLNFENKSQFLGGWVDSHTESSDNATQAGGYLFRRKNGVDDEYDYYVGFSSDVKLFRSHLQNEIKEDDKSEYERLDYYQLKSASVYGNSYVAGSYEEDKGKLFNSIYEFAKYKDKNLATEFDDYIRKQSGNNQPTPSGLIKIIEEKYPNYYDELLSNERFQEVNSEVTERLKKTILSLNRVPKSQKYKEVSFKIFTEPIKVIEELSNEKSFAYFPVSKTEFEKACNRVEKPLFLFKITNKDLSFAESYKAGKRKKKNRGKDNLHTMYFKALMLGNQNVFDIGTGEVFYRKKSLDYSDEILQKGHHYNKLKDKFDYPIISNKRYAFDKFKFHLSIVQNYRAPKNPPKEYNHDVLDYLKNNPDVNIIGLDRGERHLIYLTLINQKGEILLQESLNTIVNKKYEIETPYHTLLQNKEEERAKARENWGVIENIKELKEGYISQVVHKIAKLMVAYNAIVVMEDLNTGFKRGRFKVERQVYQKLEKMLIDKLNYLVFKDKDFNEAGGLYNALQLTNKFESFSKIGKQCGFLFYVPAWNTSKIDPTTGFVNLFYTKYESIPKAQAFFDKFKSIRYNAHEKYFEFAFDYNDFTSRAEGTKTRWIVCTYGDRIKTFRNPEKVNQWDNMEINLTEQFEDLFGKHNILFGNEECIKQQIISQDKKEFFEELFHLFKLTLQMRNSKTNSEVDYLISPVKNSKGEFYDSRKADNTLPKDADANGAYHIAKKGLMWLEQIQNYEDENWKKLNLDKTNKAWLNFVQNNAGKMVEI